MHDIPAGTRCQENVLWRRFKVSTRLNIHTTSLHHRVPAGMALKGLKSDFILLISWSFNEFMEGIYRTVINCSALITRSANYYKRMFHTYIKKPIFVMKKAHIPELFDIWVFADDNRLNRQIIQLRYARKLVKVQVVAMVIKHHTRCDHGVGVTHVIIPTVGVQQLGFLHL